MREPIPRGWLKWILAVIPCYGLGLWSLYQPGIWTDLFGLCGFGAGIYCIEHARKAMKP